MQKIDVSTVSGGCTKYIQARGVIKQWLAEEGINQLTSAGNLKPPPRRAIVNLILETWEEIIPETITNSFKSFALNLATDGSEDKPHSLS